MGLSWMPIVLSRRVAAAPPSGAPRSSNLRTPRAAAGFFFIVPFWDRVRSVSALFFGACEEHAEICYRCHRRSRKNIWRRSIMHAVIRSYSGKGTKALFDLLEKNKAEVESLIRGVKGFVSYSLVRTTRGGFSVSVYQDKAGADESTRAAREWIAKNASKTGVARPTISEGTVMLQLK